MKPYKVIDILSKPEKMAMRLDHIKLQYWGVFVTLQYGYDVYDSTVTFEDLDEANSLKIGDVFYR